MAQASRHEGNQKIFRYRNMAVTAAKDAPVCPEGKEGSVGLLISNGTSGFRSHGRFRFATGLTIRLHTTASIPREIRIDNERIRVVSRIMKSAQRRNHAIPPSAICVTAGMSLSVCLDIFQYSVFLLHVYLFYETPSVCHLLDKSESK